MSMISLEKKSRKHKCFMRKNRLPSTLN